MNNQNLPTIISVVLLLAACSTDQSTALPDTDWPLYGGNYANQRYSELDQINRNNVAGLELAWRYKTGIKATFQTNPLVQDGVMYITTPRNHVIALDAVTGTQIWRYEHQHRDYTSCCGPANRGAAMSQGKIIMGTTDARLIALDSKSGAVAWDIPITDSGNDDQQDVTAIMQMAELEGAELTGASGYTANMAPQVFENLVYIGISGAGYGLHLEQTSDGKTALTVGDFADGGDGLRGFIVAYDVNNGNEIWRWHTIRETGWEGQWREHTAYGVNLNRDIAAELATHAENSESWRIGGASVFTTPAIDPDLGLIYLGTGNPSPQMEDSSRPGDNLDSVSLVALNALTGEKVWAYQQVPHDRWGYDVASPPVLLDVEYKGKTVPAVAQASKLGWLFIHDRRNGELLFLSEPFVPQENLFARPTPAGVRIAPGTLGAVSWTPVAADPVNHAIYIPGMHQAANFYSRELETAAGQRSYSFFQQTDEDDWGLLTAIDTNTGKILWQQQMPEPMVGGALATAGELIFSGEGNGRFNAFDSHNGERLWHYQANAGVNAPPISYSINGKQYIAVAAGGNSLFGYETGDEVLVFALPD